MRPPVGAPTLTRRTRILLIVAGILVLLLLGGSRLISFYVDWLWFGEVGFRDVFTTVLFTHIVLFLIGGLLIGGLVALSLAIAYRSRPVFVPVSGPEDPIARYRTVIIQRLRLFGIGIPVLVGVIAGVAAQGNWETVQMFLNSTPFGVTDPEFGIDIGFYAFQLPFYRYVLDWLFVGIAVSFVVALIAQYIFGGIRLTGRAGQVSAAARAQLAVLAGVFVLLKAVAYYLDRYELLYSDRAQPIFTGATYTDLNAVMPAKLIMLFISIICAAAFFAAVFRRNLQLPAIATVLLVLSSVLVGAAWPQVLQQFVVAPNANEREAVPIERNIAATREAFGIDEVKQVDYSGTSEVDAAQVRQDKATVSNIRLLDPAKISQTFTQLQQRRTFYGFPSNLDIDRYEVDGELQDYVVALRELDSTGLAGNQQDWINRRLVYTHGNGIVVAPANQVNAVLEDSGGQGGLPNFTSIDLSNHESPSIPEPLRVTEPRVYYGELIEGYSIVGGEPGGAPMEYDSDTERSTYTGQGGVSVGNVFNRMVFALLYGERNILFNGSINENSKIMYVRDPEERVKNVAPWLTTDADPYPAVVDGRITWIVDGYTTLENYPYSQKISLGEATADTLGQNQLDANKDVSYVRNSVKATVDAYDGTVKLFAFDESDPVLQTWMKAFPGTVEPTAAISPSLREHLRYPEDLFKVQRELLSKYHVDNPSEFYGGVSFWDVPSDPTVQAPNTSGTGDAQPPYYIVAGSPDGQNPDTATFQLTSALVFQQRQFLSAYMSVSSDPDTYGEMTVLQLPPDTTTFGPQQVQTRFLGAPEVSEQLNILQRNQTTIEYGNLLTLPVAGGLLYVEPVYIERANQESSYPQLARVLVSYNGRVGYDANLADALDEVFGPGAGADTTSVPGAETPTTPTTPPAGSPTAPSPGAQSPDVAAAAQAIQTAITNLKTAQTAGDFAGQGAALQALDTAVQQFQAAQAAAGAATPPPAQPGG
ncbi:UPF0182 family protein [Pseudonocardia lacus]|uniref:UPF0182 family protein n=1 Tax=Pseudonocardia lacus TaxID=2835865 RepID=UPI002028D2E4|nr:UPF0182 family protein [Pseudonocardia lacus]